jgi:hypothetical protein
LAHYADRNIPKLKRALFSLRGVRFQLGFFLGEQLQNYSALILIPRVCKHSAITLNILLTEKSFHENLPERYNLSEATPVIG